MRRTLLGALAVGVLAVAAVIPIAVFAAPASSDPRSIAPVAGERIPWELSSAVWSECPMTFPNPEGLGFGWGTDELGQWYVSLYDDQGGETREDELGDAYPELVEPVRIFRECLERYPAEPYSVPPTLSAAQREMYWAYVLTELAPCLRAHDRAVELPSRRLFAGYDYTEWYLTQSRIWGDTAPLEEQLAIWRECPILPSYLDEDATDGVSWQNRPATG